MAGLNIASVLTADELEHLERIVADCGIDDPDVQEFLAVKQQMLRAMAKTAKPKQVAAVAPNKQQVQQAQKEQKQQGENPLQGKDAPMAAETVSNVTKVTNDNSNMDAMTERAVEKFFEKNAPSFFDAIMKNILADVNKSDNNVVTTTAKDVTHEQAKRPNLYEAPKAAENVQNIPTAPRPQSQGEIKEVNVHPIKAFIKNNNKQNLGANTPRVESSGGNRCVDFCKGMPASAAAPRLAQLISFGQIPPMPLAYNDNPVFTAEEIRERMKFKFKFAKDISKLNIIRLIGLARLTWASSEIEAAFKQYGIDSNTAIFEQVDRKLYDDNNNYDMAFIVKRDANISVLVLFNTIPLFDTLQGTWVWSTDVKRVVPNQSTLRDPNANNKS